MLLMIDNYDSFVYNLVRYFEELGEEIKVVRNDKITIKEIKEMNIDGIVISPGPKSPKEAGISMEIIDNFKGELPILGICLGHQCIGQYFNANVRKGKEPVHGKMFYINLAALLRKGDDLLFPKEYQCDIRMRFPIMEIEGYSTQMILDLESTIDEQLRSRLIENIINISIPILQKLESIDGIIELYGEKPELNNIYPFSSILYRKEMNNKLKAI